MEDSGTDVTRVALVGQGVSIARISRAFRELALTSGRSFELVGVRPAVERGGWIDRHADRVVDTSEGMTVDEVIDRLAALADDWLVATPGGDGRALRWATACEQRGWRFLGPSAACLRRLEDPVELRRVAEQAGVHTVPWSGSPIQSVDEAREHADRLGYPVLCRSTGFVQAGLGIAREPGQLEAVFRAACAEAELTGTQVILERLMTGVRRLEVPVVSLPNGERWAFDVIDASLRRRDGSVLVEAPAAGLDDETSGRLREMALTLAEAFAHEHLGTMAFLYNPLDRSTVFLGYDFGRGGEHAAAEVLRGVDLTKTRILLSLGEIDKLVAPEAPRGVTFAAHLRVSGERFPVILDHLRAATGPGTRTDHAASTGDRLVPGSSVAEVSAWGVDRAEALARMRRALISSAVLVHGGETSVGPLTRLLSEPDLAQGPLDVDAWQARLREPGGFAARARAGAAVIAVAIEAYELEQADVRRAFRTSGLSGRPVAKATSPRRVELEHDGQRYSPEVAALGPDNYAVSIDGQTIQISVSHRRTYEYILRVGPMRYRVTARRRDRVHQVVVDGEPHRILRGAVRVIRAPIPALVASVEVAEGQQVEAGTVAFRLEAMKMELGVETPVTGRVRWLHARPSDSVEPGSPLFSIDPEAGPTVPAYGPPVDFSALASGSTAPTAMDSALSLVLGYDVRPGSAVSAIRTDEAEPSSHRVAQEIAVLRAFLHLVQLAPASAEIEDAEGGLRLSYGEYLKSYLASATPDVDGLPGRFVERLQATLAAYDVTDLGDFEAVMEALCRFHMALSAKSDIILVVLAILGRQARLESVPSGYTDGEYRILLDRLINATQVSFPGVCESARAARYTIFDGPYLVEARALLYAKVEADVEAFSASPSTDAMERLVECPLSLSSRLLRPSPSSPERRRVHLEVLTRRYYRLRDPQVSRRILGGRHPVGEARYSIDGQTVLAVTWLGALADLPDAAPYLRDIIAGATEDKVLVDLYTWRDGTEMPSVEHLGQLADRLDLSPQVKHIVFVVGPGDTAGAASSSAPVRTFERTEAGFKLRSWLGDLHPMVAARLELHRLEAFDLERVEAAEDVYLFLGRGKSQPKDQRAFVYAEVRALGMLRDEHGRVTAIPQLEQVYAEALSSLRRLQVERGLQLAGGSHRLEMFIRPVVDADRGDLGRILRKLAPATVGLGLEQVRVNVRIADGRGGWERRLLRVTNPSGLGIKLQIEPPSSTPVSPQSGYEQKVAKLRKRGLTHPHELIRLLAPDATGASPDIPRGAFQELELDEQFKLTPVQRPPGTNPANIIVGLIKSYTPKHPEGMTRVALLGDPSRAMGSLAEPECRRIMAGLDLAAEMGIPLEWYAVSAGAEISKDRGTENMDWISAVLRRIIEFTQAGHELNVVVCGVNVGAQPYWNAEATMLMHTKGILIMVSGSAMVLTGKQALDFSGGVSAEDNEGIGGYERVMGPNGQAQYVAPDLGTAGAMLLRYYDHAYRVPGERFPRSRPTEDPLDRDVCVSPHRPVPGSTFTTVGEVFSNETNPLRKRPFDIREVMRSVMDADAEPMERWRDMRDAEMVVTWDAHLGGHPVALVGLQSRPIQRLGYIPADGPQQWSAGTFFPMSSKKMARSINAASGNRPLVILANLSGFDGSPESLRQVQLEYGAEIGRAVVNFDGPIVFTVVSRFHGGAFVVFSNRLSEQMEIFALEGTYASVIGGAPAAAVVFARELRTRIQEDPRVVELEKALREADRAHKAEVSAKLSEARAAARSDHLGQLAGEYDRIHSVERAEQVGSVHRIIPPQRLRPELIAAIERGKARTLESAS